MKPGRGASAGRPGASWPAPGSPSGDRPRGSRGAPSRPRQRAPSGRRARRRRSSPPRSSAASRRASCPTRSPRSANSAPPFAGRASTSSRRADELLERLDERRGRLVQRLAEGASRSSGASPAGQPANPSGFDQRPERGEGRGVELGLRGAGPWRPSPASAGTSEPWPRPEGPLRCSRAMLSDGRRLGCALCPLGAGMVRAVERAHRDRGRRPADLQRQPHRVASPRAPSARARRRSARGSTTLGIAPARHPRLVSREPRRLTSRFPRPVDRVLIARTSGPAPRTARVRERPHRVAPWSRGRWPESMPASRDRRACWRRVPAGPGIPRAGARGLGRGGFGPGRHDR